MMDIGNLLGSLEKHPKAVALGLTACLTSGAIGGGLYVASLQSRIEGQRESSTMYESRLQSLEDAQKAFSAQLHHLKEGFDAHSQSLKPVVGTLSSLANDHKADQLLFTKLEEVRVALADGIGRLEMSLEKAAAVESAFSSLLAARAALIEGKINPGIAKKYEEIAERLAQPDELTLEQVNSAHADLLRMVSPEEEFVAVGLNNLGISYKKAGDYERARENFGEALAISRQTGDLKGEAAISSNLAFLVLERGDLEAAERHLRRSLSIYHTMDLRNRNVPLVLERLGDIKEAQNRRYEAMKFYSQAFDFYRLLYPEELPNKKELLDRYAALLQRYGERDEELERILARYNPAPAPDGLRRR